MSDQTSELELCGATVQLYLSDKDNVLTAYVDTTGLPTLPQPTAGKHAALPQPIPALAHTSLQPQGENQ